VATGILKSSESLKSPESPESPLLQENNRLVKIIKLSVFKNTFEDVEVANYASLNNYTLLENLTGASKEITNLTNGVKYYFVITSITTIDKQ
jgi:hypothetical protein